MTELNGLSVCFIAGTLRRGGTERQLDYVLRALQEAGAGLHVVSLDSGEFWEQPFRDRGIKVSTLADRRSRASRLAALVALVRRERPLVIHGFHFYVNLYAVAVARLTGCLEIGSLRNDLDGSVRSMGPVFGPLSLHCPRHLVVNACRTLQAARERGVDDERLAMLPNVVDTTLYRPGQARSPAAPFTILLVARHVPQKRIDRFMRLLAEVRGIADRELLGVFIGDRGRRGNDVAAVARENGLPNSAVDLRGALEPEAVAAAYREADLFVLTSDFEGTPNALMEAMASGLPCVATACGDVPRLLDDGRGVVVPVGDDAGLRSAVLLLMQDEDMRRRLGRRARAYIEREHGTVRLPERLRRLYSAVCSA